MTRSSSDSADARFFRWARYIAGRVSHSVYSLRWVLIVAGVLLGLDYLSIAVSAVGISWLYGKLFGFPDVVPRSSIPRV